MTSSPQLYQKGDIMRRVYDDTHFEEVADAIYEALWDIHPREVSEYSYGTYRAIPNLIFEDVLHKCKSIKRGADCNHTGIGNNNAFEIIYTEGKEEQICGILHLTDNMFGDVICWFSDIDGERETDKITIRGTK